MRHGKVKSRTISTAMGLGMVLLVCSSTGLSACTTDAGVAGPTYAQAYPYDYDNPYGYPYDDPLYGSFAFDYGFGGHGWDHHGFDHGHFDHGHFAHAGGMHGFGGHGGFGGHAGGGGHR